MEPTSAAFLVKAVKQAGEKAAHWLITGPEPGAGLPDKRVRPSRVPAVNKAKRTITAKDVERFSRAVLKHDDFAGIPKEERAALVAATGAIVRNRPAGEIDMEAVQAAHLKPEWLAASLRRDAPAAYESLDATQRMVLDALVDAVCTHVVEFFTTKDTFLARTVVAMRQERADQLARSEQRHEAYFRAVRARLTRTRLFGLELAPEHQTLDLGTAFVNLRIDEPDDTAQNSTASHRLDLLRLTVHRRKLLLEGPAGAGKSTLLQHLAIEVTQRRLMVGSEPTVPFYLRLREWVHDGRFTPPRPGEFANATTSTAPQGEPGWEADLLQAGLAVVLVDGMDEIPEEHREAAVSWLVELVSVYPDSLYVVTSRPQALRRSWRDELRDMQFHRATISPMSHAQIEQFIDRWHSAAQQNAVDDEDVESCAAMLKSALEKRRDLSRLATTPLLCAMMCALHRADNGVLPHSRTELYRRALGMLLEGRDKQQGIQTTRFSASRDQVEVLLAKLAFWMVLEKRRTIPWNDALTEVEDHLPIMRFGGDGEATSEAVLRYLLERSGVLQDPAMDLLEFRHPSIQDYLAATRIFQRNNLGFLLENAHDPLFHDIAIMAVSQSQSDSERQNRILDGLITRAGSDPGNAKTLWLLAAACVAEPGIIDPERTALIRERTRELLPPQSDEDAQTLARAGTFVLDLLADLVSQTDLPPATMKSVIRTVEGISVDEPVSLAILRRFRATSSELVRQLLVDLWEQAADPASYADAVVAGMAIADLAVTAAHEAMLRQIIRFPEITSLQIQQIDVDAEWLPRLPNLVSLCMVRSSFDLGSLSQLAKLRELSLFDLNVSDLSPLSALTGLTALQISSAGWHDLAPLSALVNLRELRLDEMVPMDYQNRDRSVDLAPLANLRNLTSLHLRQMTNVDLTPIASLPCLTKLHLDELPGADLLPLADSPSLQILSFGEDLD